MNTKISYYLLLKFVYTHFTNSYFYNPFSLLIVNETDSHAKLNK